MADAVSPLYRVLQAQATLDHTRASTMDTQALGQQRLLGVLMNQRAFDRREQMNEALRSGQFSNPASTPGGAGGAVGTNYEYGSPLIDSLKSAQEGINTNRQLMSIAQNAGDMEMYRKAQSEYNQNQKEYRLAQQDVAKDDERRNREAVQSFGQANTAEDVTNGLQYVQDNLGAKQAKQIEQQLMQALPGGLEAATPQQIEAALKPVLNRYTARGNILRFNSAAAGAANTAERNAEIKAQNQIKNAAAAQKQAGLKGATGIAGSSGSVPFEQLTTDRQDAVKLYADMAIGGDNSWRVGLRNKGGSDLILQVDEFIPRRAKELSLDASDIGTNKAKRAGAQSAYTQLSKDIAFIEPFATMLDQNAEILKDLSRKIIKTDSALINRPINWLQANVGDNPDYADFNTQLRLVQTEAARIISNPRLVGQLTDTARKEIEEVAAGTMPLGATERVIDRLMNDSQRRVGLMREQQHKLETTIREMTPSSKRQAAQSGGQIAPAATGSAPQAAVDYLRANPALKEQFKAKYGYVPEGI